jgi:hypothetical protein
MGHWQCSRLRPASGLREWTLCGSQARRFQESRPPHPSPSFSELLAARGSYRLLRTSHVRVSPSEFAASGESLVDIRAPSAQRTSSRFAAAPFPAPGHAVLLCIYGRLARSTRLSAHATHILRRGLRYCRCPEAGESLMADRVAHSPDPHDPARCANPNCTATLQLCWNTIERLQKQLAQLQAELDRVQADSGHLRSGIDLP